MKITPVILSGGSGTRLWPLSRQLYPKQLLPLVNDKTMLQDTVTRVRHIPNVVNNVLVVCNEEHRFLVAEQLRAIGIHDSRILLEPEGRNTAPALTLAALSLNPEDIMLVMPADHVIQDMDAFQQAINEAADLANDDYVVTFGIVPDCAETGYGYIQRGEKIADKTIYQIARFVEKPNQVTAEGYVTSGDYYWNSGMFILKAGIWLAHLENFNAPMVEACRQAVAKGSEDHDFFRADKAAFLSSPSDSIDYAVMEKLTASNHTLTAVVPLQAQWSDVGAFAALWEIGHKDGEGNVTKGDVKTISSRDSLLLSQGRLIAGVGLTDTIVVETADAVLVANRHHVQDVKKIVEWLKQEKREEHIIHRRVYRPWGSYESIDVGQRYQVKRITVTPGAALSLQMHHHRAEHWVVVNGTAKVTRGEETFIVSENESTFIPIGTKHRLENPGAIPLEMIEVQSGSYLGEDDIVRFEDQYGRSK